MNENTTAVVVEFTAEESVDLSMNPSRPSKAEALAIGLNYFEADHDAQDALLDDLGPVLVRRSLRAFSNYASRTNQPQVAEYAAMLRDEITVLRGEGDETEAAS